MSAKRMITPVEIEQAVLALDSQIVTRHCEKEFKKWPARIYGVPRGGEHVVKAILALHKNDGPGPQPNVVDALDLGSADFIVDDLIDSGATRDRYSSDILFLSLFSKPRSLPEKGNWLSMVTLQNNDWVIFPWEKDTEGSASDIVTRLLEFIGEDPKRGGLKETPKRVLSAWQEWTSGYGKNPADVLKTFEDGAQNYDEMVLVSNIPVVSKCEHHLADIFGIAHVAYIPNGTIVGLSKIPRLVDIFARRLQVQERLTCEVADAMQEHLKPKGVGVVLQCRHACMESRGISVRGTITTTSALRGVLRESSEARAEFLKLVDTARNGTVI